MIQPTQLPDDRRAAVTALSHALTLGMTSLLVIALLIGVTGFLDTQQSTTGEGELRTIGNRLAGELSHVDELGRQGGSVNLTTTHPARVAGSTYEAQLEHDAGPPDDCASVDEDTCLVLTATEFESREVIPIFNRTEITLQSSGEGEFRLQSAGTMTNVGAEFTAVDMTSRIGIGSDVVKDTFDTLVASGNDPPVATFTTRPAWPQNGTEVQLSANRSYDPDGNITEYQWDFDNDGTIDDTTTNSYVLTTFPPGRQNVTLRVKDDASTITNFTREIDVSGLTYLRDLDPAGGPTPSQSQGVTFTLENNFGESVELQRIRIDPADDSIDHLWNTDGGDEPEVLVEPNVEPNEEINEDDFNERFEIYDGGRVLEFGVDGDDTTAKPTIQAGSQATVTIRDFGTPTIGKRMTIGIRYDIGGEPNSTVLNDTVGGPEITNYELVPTGQDVDLHFDSSEPLTSISVQLGGDASGTLSRADFTETGSGPYHYRADVSTGAVGTFWAKLLDARSLGTPSDDPPLNDTAIVTGDVVWKLASDWDAAQSETGLVHASFGDHLDSEVSLGYSPDGNGLVGYWPLDDPSADDRSGEGNDGIPQGSPVAANGIGVSESYHFDPSTNDHIVVPNDPSLELGVLDRATVSAWVNIDTNSQTGWRAIVQHSDESYNLQFRNGDIPRFTVHNDGNWVSAERAGGSISQSTWYHFVGVYDGSEVRFYVDGSLAGTNSVPDMDETSQDLGIAENLDEPGRYLDGKIDEVRIYDRALASSEILDLHQAATFGKMRTNVKVNASGDMDVSNLDLQYNAEIDPDETIEVKVHSDQGESSPWIALSDGSGSTGVNGLSQDTDSFWLEIRLDSVSPTHSPVLNKVGLSN